MSKYCLFALVILSNYAHAKVLTLDILKENYKKNNFKIKSFEEELQGEVRNLEGAKSKYFPTVGISLGKENLSSSKIDQEENIKAIYGEINLFKGYRDQNAISKAKIDKNLSKVRLGFIKFKGELLIEKQYFQYLFLKKRLSILKFELRRSNTHIKMVKKRLSSKIITETDLLEFRLQRKKLQSLINYVSLELRTIKEYLVLNSGLESSKEYEIQGLLPHYKLISKLEDILNSRDDSFLVHQNSLDVKIADLNKKNSISNWYPSIDFKIEHGNLDETETGIESSQVSSKATLMATWEINLGGKTIYENKSKSNRLNAAEYRLKENRLKYEIRSRKLFSQLKMLENLILSEEKNTKLAKSIYENSLKEYKKGIKDSGALLSSSNEYSEMESRIYQLKLNYIHKKIELEELVSKRLQFKIVSH